MHDEQRRRTTTFAHEEQVKRLRLRIDTLERERGEQQETRQSKQHSYASRDTEQYDIFGNDGMDDYDEDYDEDDPHFGGDWTEPVRVDHRPKPTPKVFAGQSQTQTRTPTTASASAAARDDGGRPPRRPDSGGGGGGDGSGGGNAPAPDRKPREDDRRRSDASRRGGGHGDGDGGGDDDDDDFDDRGRRDRRPARDGYALLPREKKEADKVEIAAFPQSSANLKPWMAGVEFAVAATSNTPAAYAWILEVSEDDATFESLSL